MRVVILSQHFWPETFRINDVAALLAARRHDITVLTGQPNYPEGKVFAGYQAWRTGCATENGLRICRVPLVPRASGGALRLVLNYLSFVVFASLFGPWLLRGRKPEVIFVYGTSPILQAIPAIVLGWLTGAKVVVWVQDLWPESLRATGFVRNPRLLNAVAAVVRWIYRRSDLLLVQSEAFLSPVEAMAGSTPVVFFPNPGDREPDTTGQAPLTLEPGFNILFAGNLGAAQSLETVVAAAEEVRDLKDLRVVVIGSGRMSGWLADEVGRRCMSNVRLAGRFPPDAMPALFAQADALLVTLGDNPTLHLTVPSKVQAYMAAGRPILAAVNGEGARIVTLSSAGIATPAEDGHALAMAMRTLYSTPENDRARMGAAGRHFFEKNYDPDLLIGRLETLFAAVLQPATTPGDL